MSADDLPLSSANTSILVSLLVCLIVLAIVFAIVRAILPILGLGAPFDLIVNLVLMLIALFVVLNFTGMLGAGYGWGHSVGCR